MFLTHMRTFDVRVIMDLQDVRVGSAVNAYKAYEHAATVQLQCSANTVDYLPSTTIVWTRLESTTSHC
jgi:hypothetical protein